MHLCISLEGFPEVPVAPGQGTAASHRGKLSPVLYPNEEPPSSPTSCRERKQQRQELHVITTAENSTGRLLRPQHGHAEVFRLGSAPW